MLESPQRFNGISYGDRKLGFATERLGLFFLRNSLIFIVLLLSLILSHNGSIVGIDGVIFAGQNRSYTCRCATNINLYICAIRNSTSSALSTTWRKDVEIDWEYGSCQQIQAAQAPEQIS